jgi:hypothetical protein
VANVADQSETCARDVITGLLRESLGCRRPKRTPGSKSASRRFTREATSCILFDLYQLFPELFINYLDLFVDYLAGEPIDGHACLTVGRRSDRRRVHPVMHLTFDDKLGKGICGARACVGLRRITPALRDQVKDREESADDLPLASWPHPATHPNAR